MNQGFEKKRSVIIVQGVMPKSFLDKLKADHVVDVVVLEGRPDFEASKTACRELLKRGITPTVMADNMAGYLFYKDFVKEVWLSCRMFEKQGALCHIGALILAVLGKTHHVPVYAYPMDEDKKVLFVANSKELCSLNGKRIAPSGIKAYVPLMEWVAEEYITEGNVNV